jgi:hypothetical protein
MDVILAFVAIVDMIIVAFGRRNMARQARLESNLGDRAVRACAAQYVALSSLVVNESDIQTAGGVAAVLRLIESVLIIFACVGFPWWVGRELCRYWRSWRSHGFPWHPATLKGWVLWAFTGLFISGFSLGFSATSSTSSGQKSPLLFAAPRRVVKL